MQSPNRIAVSVGNSNTLTSLQTPHILNNLSKALSTSANALSGMETVSRNQPQQLQLDLQQVPQSLSRQPYYHNTITQTVPTYDHSIPNLTLNSNVPVTVSSKLLSPTDMPSSGNAFIDNPNCLTPNISSAEIQVESPKNVTIVQPAKFQPYKEVTKPFEMSDFYKYSTKFRQKTASANMMQSESNSPQLPPKNIMHQAKPSHRHMCPVLLGENVAEQTSPVYPVNQ